MSNIYDLSPQERRQDAASVWIARLDRGLNARQAAELQRWMAEHPDNERMILEMASLWDKMDTLGRLSTLFPPPEKPSSRIPLILGAAAGITVLAVALLLVFAVSLPGHQPHPEPTEYVYQTAVGEKTEITLADGTALVLNTDSRITVQYTERFRLISLERGELYVDVAPDKRRPLSVVAADQIVRAVGTQFNVRITTDQQIELMVLEGRVRVGVRERSANPLVVEEPILAAGTTRSLAAGESTILGSPEVAEISPADMEVRLSWREGNLIFRGESLEDAMREVERYTPGEFVFLDQDLKKIRIAGLFRAGDVDGLLATLQENFDIVYRYSEEQKVLLGKR